MAPRCSWDGLFDSALQLGFVSGRPGQLLDVGSGLKPVLAVHDRLLAGLKPGIDQGYAIAGLRDCDRAHLLGLKWLSQHLERGGCDDCSEAAFGSVRARRLALAWSALCCAAGGSPSLLGCHRGGILE